MYARQVVSQLSYILASAAWFFLSLFVVSVCLFVCWQTQAELKLISFLLQSLDCRDSGLRTWTPCEFVFIELGGRHEEEDAMLFCFRDQADHTCLGISVTTSGVAVVIHKHRMSFP